MRCSRLSPLERVDAMLGAGAGLAYLHGRREAGDGGPDVPVVHRDVKSANIGLAVQGDGLYAKLYDCGLAMQAAGAGGGGGAVSFTGGLAAGTAAYMAPEVVHGSRVLANDHSGLEVHFCVPRRYSDDVDASICPCQGRTVVHADLKFSQAHLSFLKRT